MRMALIGKVEEFLENGNWIEYTERLEHYFTANEITDAGKKRRCYSARVERKRTS